VAALLATDSVSNICFTSVLLFKLFSFLDLKRCLKINLYINNRMLGDKTYPSLTGIFGVCQCLCHEGEFVRDDRSDGQSERYPTHQSNSSGYLP